jgi:acyl carrier protein
MENGQLFVTGRLKDLIIINGQNHYPQDIEGSVEKAHPSLRPGCGAVFSVEEEGEEALVVMQEIEKADEDFNSILAAIRQAVAIHHELKIRALVLLPKGNIPKTSSGKISRYACRESFLDGSGEPLFLWKKSSKASSSEGVASSSAPQEKESSIPGDKQNVGTIRDWLVQQLSGRLGLRPQEIDILKPITTYGLDSKDAINLSGELEDWLGKTLSPSLIWKYPTIAQLALHLSGEGELS